MLDVTRNTIYSVTAFICVMVLTAGVLVGPVEIEAASEHAAKAESSHVA